MQLGRATLHDASRSTPVRPTGTIACTPAMALPSARAHARSPHTQCSVIDSRLRASSVLAATDCICHGGSALPPDWLGNDYFCDSALRGGTGCSIGPFEPSDGGCTSAEDCYAQGCNASFWELGSWYGGRAPPIFDNTSVGYLCQGSRYATASDFPGRPFGSFLHTVPDGNWVDDPIEARIMAGQTASNADLSLGNEDVALRSLEIEVFGCRSSPAPVCGDGTTIPPEQCDSGVDALTNRSNNDYNRDCSIGCTVWNLPSCSQLGTCYVPPPPPPLGQDMPGKQEVGSTLLPAWVKIADVDFDELLRGDSVVSRNETDCVNCAPQSTIHTCPGSLEPALNPFSRRFFCAAPLADDYNAAGPANFYISLPKGTRAVGFRGRVVTGSSGQLDGFLNVPWMPLDYSPRTYADASLANFTSVAGVTMFPNERSSSIEGRYVDGLSLTVDCTTCARPRI